jgi:myo-inositol-1(or 4)-monophosphatase
MDQRFSSVTLLAIDAALLAGEILRRGFGSHFSIECKKEGLQNLVTEYDRLSEKTVIEYILHHHPSSHFLAEESGNSGKDSSETLWVIDPLDGTVNFAHGIPFFSVSIAAAQKKQVVSGVIYNPITRELFVSERGKGSFCNGKKIGVSKVSKLQDSYLASGFPYHVNKNPQQCIERTAEVLRIGCPIRLLGSAALDLAYTASGRFDGFFEVSLAPWDVAAGLLILEEAGGRVTHWDRKPFDLFANGNFLATNGLIHDSLSKILCS